MNMVNLQLDFYRRFNDAASRLTYNRCGMLCTLLGSPNLSGAKSLTCSLSMGVTAVARRLDSGYVKLESTDSNISLNYSVKDAFKGENKPEREILSLIEKTGFNGAEILYDCDIAPGYSIDPPLRAAVLKAILNILHAKEQNPEDMAILCRGGKDVPFYTAMLSSKRGWCTYLSKNTVKHYPLPMTGLLFLAVQVRRKPHPPRDGSLNKELQRLRSIHPSVYTYSDITTDMLTDTDYSYLPHIAAENERIDEACKVLKFCNIEKFADIVNESARSVAEYFNTSDEQNFLSRIMPGIDGCLCARASDNGVYSIVEADVVDYVIDRVNNKFEERFGYEPQFAVTSPA